MPSLVIPTLHVASPRWQSLGKVGIPVDLITEIGDIQRLVDRLDVMEGGECNGKPAEDEEGKA